MSTTATVIINEALNDLGVTRPGETVSTSVLNDLLLRLNQRISAHSIEQLMAQTNLHSSYALSIGVTRYTFGVGGSFATFARPEKVTGWRATYGTFSTGGHVVTLEQLQAASSDPLGSNTSLPSAVGADAAYPLINIGVFPAPGLTPGILELSYWIALTQFADLTTAYTFPDGWHDFLHFDLALAIAPRYQRQGFDPASLIANAGTARAKIAALNTPAQAPQQ